MWSDLIFTKPTVHEARELGSFCTKCIDISYGTRTCSDEVSDQILTVTESQVTSGLVEMLVHPDTKDLIGFFALKDPAVPLADTVKDTGAHTDTVTVSAHTNTTDTLSIELGNLFVHPDYHHQGIGTRLFQQAISKAKSLNRHRMTWVSDPGAEAFYRKIGASATGHDHNILNPAVPVPLFEIQI